MEGPLRGALARMPVAFKRHANSGALRGAHPACKCLLAGVLAHSSKSGLCRIDPVHRASVPELQSARESFESPASACRIRVPALPLGSNSQPMILPLTTEET
eukprot:CAMPEP_0174292278 /NCGR_PEP_ID=MMETSP0809-20121228/34910_1 /TAXON_ID=73025 ORGANISM="Eutreptiella gymnastica-like, Strain CCMP1594" /NCGR_SAMPLE_ID=MMETSP0809 /ASSEMBLY_ACC=CAM_ASM_000658 /LENGTH=101 /DNA_ID=CAMNT_0015392237 /DNA_START=694 /DNA_END=999 /DNA_ORIENTATION=-